MALPSNVPKIEFTPTGLVIPTESEILTGVQADINQAFGGGVNPSLETPQGQLASSEAAVIGDKNNEFLYYVTQVDPLYASGRFQDAIGRIYFLTRKPATPTIVFCNLGGLPGTVIPPGTLAQDTNGNTYLCTNGATISDASTALNVEFENVLTGPIPCAASSLTQVYQSIAGWDTITNPADGVLGQNVESRAEFEYRRKNSVAINAQGSVQAMYANVFQVENVIDVFVIDNPTGATVNYGATAFPLLPHSVFVGVVGGEDDEVGPAIWEKKDMGCDMNGNTTVTVVDDTYSYPQPEYTITFNRPDPVPILFDVDIVDDPQLPSDIVARVKAAIIARFNGVDGSQRERMGATIFAGRYYASVATTSPIISIISIFVDTSGPVDQLQVPIGIDQYPTLSESDITVTLV